MALVLSSVEAVGLVALQEQLRARLVLQARLLEPARLPFLMTFR